MSEEEEKEEEGPAASSMAAFSDKITDMGEALDILYIAKNASGRNRFREKWPEVADYLFGTELIKYDVDGVEDKEHRKKLEEEADDRRIALKETLGEIVSKSVDAGSLQFDYVGEVIDQYGVYMSTYLYAEDVIERVRPGLLATRIEKTGEAVQEEQAAAVLGDDLSDTTSVSDVSEELQVEKDDMADTAVVAEEKEADKDEAAPVSDEKLSSEEKTLLSNNTDVPEVLADVKPIETSAPPVPPAPDALEAVPPVPPSEPNEAASPPLPPVEPNEGVPPLPQTAEAASPDIPPIPPVSPEVPPEPAEAVKPIETPVPPPVDPNPVQSQPETPPPPPLPEPPATEKPPEDSINPPPLENPAPPVDAGIPDVLKPPPEAENPAPPLPTEEGKSVEELTLPQAAKAEKGVYMTMFNALAKAA